MSTVSALMVVATGSITRDIYQNIINPKSTNERILKLSRIITILIGLSGITIGICKPSSIFEIVRFAFGGMGVWAIAVILGMYWKHTTTAGILSGIFVAEIYYIYLKINKLDGTALALGLDSLITSWLLGMAVAITVSLFTKPVNDEVIQRHFE